MSFLKSTYVEAIIEEYIIGLCICVVSSMSLGQSVNRLSKYAQKDDVDYHTMLVFIMFTSNFVSSLEEKYHHG